jgi:hypothetical protein
MLHLVEAPDRDDIGVEVTVGSSKDSDLFKRTNLCTLRRGQDGHGVGIFVSISKAPLYFGFVFTCKPIDSSIQTSLPRPGVVVFQHQRLTSGGQGRHNYSPLRDQVAQVHPYHQNTSEACIWFHFSSFF